MVLVGQKTLFDLGAKKEKKERSDEETHVAAKVILSYPDEILDVDGHFIRLEAGKVVFMTKKAYEILRGLGYVR